MPRDHPVPGRLLLTDNFKVVDKLTLSYNRADLPHRVGRFVPLSKEELKNLTYLELWSLFGHSEWDDKAHKFVLRTPVGVFRFNDQEPTSTPTSVEPFERYLHGVRLHYYEQSD